MREAVTKLIKEKWELEKRIDEIDTAILNLRAVCNHVMPNGDDAFDYKGSDSHADYFKCQLCGLDYKH